MHNLKTSEIDTGNIHVFLFIFGQLEQSLKGGVDEPEWKMTFICHISECGVLLNLETAAGSQQSVKDIGVHGEIQKIVVTLGFAQK